MIFFKAACSSHPWQYRACIFFVLSKTRDNFPRDENTSVGCSVFAGLERSASQGRSYYWFSLKKKSIILKDLYPKNFDSLVMKKNLVLDTEP